MVYVESKSVGTSKYFYAVKNIRTDGRWKKFRIYIGKNLSKEEIEKNRKKHLAGLERKIENYLKKTDVLESIISESDVAILNKIKEKYRKVSKRSPTAKEKYYEWFVTTFTYNSNAIEGSTISLQETSMILFDKITPPEKTLREVREVENHKKAFDYVLGYKGDVNKPFVLKIHEIVSSGILPKEESGKFRKVQVYVRGAEEVPPKLEEVEKEFEKLMKWYRKNKKRYHPVVLSSYFHAAFEGIHPFVDFNGRTGRLLLNFMLLKNGFPAIDIRNRERMKYYDAIRRALKGDLKPFVNLTIKYIKDIGNKL